MRVAVLWKAWSYYIHACVTELADRHEVLAFTTGVFAQAPYSVAESPRVKWRIGATAGEISGALQDFEPEVILICSWDIDAYRLLALRHRGRAVRVLFMDNQWLGTGRQWLGVATSPWFLWRRFDCCFVPGARQLEFARRLGLGVPMPAVGGYSTDTSLFRSEPGERGFLFVARLVDTKGVRELVSAYRSYRSGVTEPWDLTVCGTGPLVGLLEAEPGIRLLGFVQPHDLPEVMASNACLLLPSVFEPWGVVVHEAAACGLHVIASTAVGAADDLVEAGVNGQIIDPSDSVALAEALLWMHDRTAVERVRGSSASKQRASMITPQRWVQELEQVVDRAGPWRPSLTTARRRSQSTFAVLLSAGRRRAMGYATRRRSRRT
jgi:glycosyltransferase involved in cell wall biosynthesis